MTVDPILSARIYVVDDEAVNLRLLERFLGLVGFEDIHSFTDPRAALAATEAHEPDLILLDLHMPGLDGFDVLAALHELISDDDFLPVLILTGDQEREARSRALASGATDFLAKPFYFEELTLRTRNLIRTRQLHEAVRTHNRDLTVEVRATSDALAEVEAHWRSVTQGLARLTRVGSVEATAAAVCAEFAKLPDLAGVALFEFEAEGTVVPLTPPAPPEFGSAVKAAISAGHLTKRPREATRWGSAESWLAELPIGTHRRPRAEERFSAAIFVPLRSESATLGLLVAGGTGPDAADVLARRRPALEAFAAIASALLAPEIEERRHADAMRMRVRRLIDERAFEPVFQPIVDLTIGTTVGYEALTRFHDRVRPDRRFAAAAAVGLGLELEVATLTAAIAAARELPADRFVSLNVSPELVLEGNRLASLLLGTRAPVVLELTEHAPVDDYQALRGAIDRLGSSVRVAVDDAGAGYSSFRHVVELRPDFVKIDIGLVRTIARDAVRRAFVAGMTHFALGAGCTLIAEGVESEAERAVLQGLAVGLGQGYLFGRPAPARAMAEARSSRGADLVAKSLRRGPVPPTART